MSKEPGIYFTGANSMGIPGSFSFVGSYAEQDELTNSDVIALVHSGLSEESILRRIESSPTHFEMTVKAILDLKEADVPIDVIDAMIAATADEPDRSPSAKEESLPESYGTYVLQEGQFLQLRAQKVDVVAGLRLGSSGVAVDGFHGEPDKTLTNVTIFIIYEPQINIRSMQLLSLSYIEKMKAHQFDVSNTPPQFFQKIYGKSPNEHVLVNLWRPSDAVAIAVGPVSGHPDMYKITTSGPLSTGRYALYQSGTIHNKDIVGTMVSFKPSAGFYFKVGY